MQTFDGFKFDYVGGVLTIHAPISAIVSNEAYKDNDADVYRLRFRGNGWEWVQPVDKQTYIGVVTDSITDDQVIELPRADLVGANSTRPDLPIVVDGRIVGYKPSGPFNELRFNSVFGEQSIFVDNETFAAICAD